MKICLVKTYIVRIQVNGKTVGGAVAIGSGSPDQAAESVKAKFDKDNESEHFAKHGDIIDIEVFEAPPELVQKALQGQLTGKVGVDSIQMPQQGKVGVA